MVVAQAQNGSGALVLNAQFGFLEEALMQKVAYVLQRVSRGGHKLLLMKHKHRRLKGL